MRDLQKMLQDMVNSILSIETYSLSSYQEFQNDEKSQDAIMYNLIILGEAANQVPDSFQEAHPEIPWSSLIGTRNVIVHGYDQVKLPIVWDIIHKNLPELKQKLMELI